MQKIVPNLYTTIQFAETYPYLVMFQERKWAAQNSFFLF